MARRRSISTTMSTDKRLNRLAVEYGDFAAMLYTWMIPHAADDTTLNGDVEEFMATVIPMRRDKSVEDVMAALQGMHDLGLIIWERDISRIRFPHVAFYAHQTVIKKENRVEDWPAPENTTDHHESPRNTVSFPVPVPVTSSVPVPDPVSPPPVAAPPSARQQRPGRAPREPLTDEQRQRLLVDFAQLPDTAERIEEALTHEAARKCTSEYLYLRNWLRRERERHPALRSNGHGPPRNGYARTGPLGLSVADEDERLTEQLRQRNAEALRGDDGAMPGMPFT